MKKFWVLLGQIVWPFLWPLRYLVLNNSQRSRLVIMSEGQILVVKSWLGNGEWSLPGGGIHKKETPLKSAVRELREETDIEIDQKLIKPLTEFTNKHHGINIHFIAFTASIPKQVHTKSQLGEIIDIAWLEPHRLLNDGRLSPDAKIILSKFNSGLRHLSSR